MQTPLKPQTSDDTQPSLSQFVTRKRKLERRLDDEFMEPWPQMLSFKTEMARALPAQAIPKFEEPSEKDIKNLSNWLSTKYERSLPLIQRIYPEAVTENFRAEMKCLSEGGTLDHDTQDILRLSCSEEMPSFSTQ